MSSVFLDANFLVDLLENRRPISLNDFEGHILFASPLSFHIAAYAFKYKIPNQKLGELINDLQIVSLNNQILEKALSGPTPDLEDNIQLHSAAASDCNVFLTSDAKLLRMKFFGKARIASTFDHPA